MFRSKRNRGQGCLVSQGILEDIVFPWSRKSRLAGDYSCSGEYSRVGDSFLVNTVVWGTAVLVNTVVWDRRSGEYSRVGDSRSGEYSHVADSRSGGNSRVADSRLV